MRTTIYLVLATLREAFLSRAALHLENLALRQQLAIVKRKSFRPSLRLTDRLFWVTLSHVWPRWREALVIVKPETVIDWHRKGFRSYWTWKSRRRKPGRPPVATEVRDLIRRMSRENPLWGAPRIHGELLKLGIEVSEAAVSKYLARHPKPPSQTWRTFLENHVGSLASIDFFVVGDHRDLIKPSHHAERSADLRQTDPRAISGSDHVRFAAKTAPMLALIHPSVPPIRPG